jgi:hypothetical protein
MGGFNPSEKYESQLGLLFPIYGKIINVPNNQPGIISMFNELIIMMSGLRMNIL